MTDRSRPVPQARLARLAVFGQMAGGIAAGALGEGARRLARGERPQISDLLLTPANALRVTDQLSRLRGAAMKLGQMLSLDAGDVLPAELTAILARLREAAHIMPPAQLNRVLVAGDARFVVPEPCDKLLRLGILPMDFIEGDPIDTLAQAPQATRDAVMGALFDLVLHEVFVWGEMQTDPNFANFRWQPATGRLLLLDFGAARAVPPETAGACRALLRAGLAGDEGALRAALQQVGFTSPTLVARHGATRDALAGIVLRHVTASRATGQFAFADRSIVADLRARAAPLIADRASWHIPPVETLFVQRKISGTAMFCVRMGARLPLLDMVGRHAGT